MYSKKLKENQKDYRNELIVIAKTRNKSKKDLKQRDRKMKGSNILIIKNKRHPRPLSNINGKQSNLRTTRSAEQRYAKQTRRE